ncbi:HOP2-like protein [Saccharomyces eubayanus]|nr:HOP2-like protein [Saccharomyces eubayanus]KOG99474.1 HOP2-like protein [Saccharomyces eubayanus]
MDEFLVCIWNEFLLFTREVY